MYNKQKIKIYQKIVSGGNMLTFLVSHVWGLVLITEEELLEYSDIAIEGEVISSECLSSSVDDNGTTTTQFEATLSIISTIKGENISSEVTLYTSQVVESDGAPESNCAWTDFAHPVGEKGTYYLVEEGGGYELYTQGFIPAGDSNPSDAPECVSLEDQVTDTGDKNNDIAEGSCNHQGTSPSSFILLTMLTLFFRRK